MRAGMWWQGQFLGDDWSQPRLRFIDERLQNHRAPWLCCRCREVCGRAAASARSSCRGTP